MFSLQMAMAETIMTEFDVPVTDTPHGDNNLHNDHVPNLSNISRHSLPSAGNSTDYSDFFHPYVDDHAYNTMVQVEKYVVPTVCVLGLIGNTLSTITFMRIPLRRAPCSLYLAVRGLSDNGFLLSLLLTWISSTFDLRLSQVRGVCQSIIYSTYVCGCVSVWLCVLITFENFMLIQSPHTARRMCRSVIAKVCTGVLICLIFIVYSPTLWIMNDTCRPKSDYASITQILVYSDTILTLVLPTVIIFLLLFVIAYKVLKILHIRKKFSDASENNNRDCSTKTRRNKNVLPIAKVTKMLFVVSLVYFALTVPSHVIRLWIMVGSFTKGHHMTSITLATIQLAFQILYYTSFSINITVYAAFGSNFRRLFRQTFCRYENPSVSTFVQTEAINLVRTRLHSTGNTTEVTKFAETTLLMPSSDQHTSRSEDIRSV